MSGPTDNDKLIIRRQSRLGILTLNRPKVLNALDLDMVRAMRQALEAWAGDPDVAYVIVEGAGEKGLCAGGDVVSAVKAAGAGDRQLARTFWAEEYALNSMIAHYPKPYIALMDGVVMGGGVGISAHGSHRIVTERSRLAMPETAIGLLPDVGGTWLLSRVRGHAGAYLGLTGRPMHAADAIWAGFADRMIPGASLGELKERLCNPFAGTLERVLDGLSADPGASKLAAEATAIDACFSQASIERILAALEARGDSWASEIIEGLSHRSPLSLKITLASIRGARTLKTLEDALNKEYRLACRLLDHGEFREGVRALLIDKDKKPKWSPGSLAEVDEAMISAFFAPMLPGEDLALKPPSGQARIPGAGGMGASRDQ